MNERNGRQQTERARAAPPRGTYRYDEASDAIVLVETKPEASRPWPAADPPSERLYTGLYL